MGSKAGVGFSDQTDSLAAGAEAAKQAMASAGLTRGDAALLFSTGRHNPHKLRDGVRSVIGPTCRLFGGYGVGIITHDHLAYDGHEVGIVIIQSDTWKIDAVIETGLPGNERATGQRLGEKLVAGGLHPDDDLVLLYDSVNVAKGQPRLNMATPLMAGMSQHVKQWPDTAGMGMIGDMQLQPTYQWFDDRIEQGSAMAIRFGGELRMDSIIMHGCRPAGRYYTITRTEGPVVLEIDNKPALSVIHDMLGPDGGLSPEDYSFFITLGVNKGDPYGPFKEDDYANRMCIGIDSSRHGLVMFEDDLQPGMKVQLMRRSMDFSYIGPRTKELLKRVEGRRPVFAFYIDCAGRAGAYCGLDAEEAVEVQKALPKEIPLLGVYSGVEIAKVGGAVQALDWTGVLCLFSE
ncbi:MAG: FIST N-terminal domain-containing protein [Phycisphaeraceae bacterium]